MVFFHFIPFATITGVSFRSVSNIIDSVPRAAKLAFLEPT